MLKLKGITKDYSAGDTVAHALRGIDIAFRRSEFVSILGPSGCGKTTLLNIIGGLDQYSSGDLVINGRSTKDFKDHDWDSYRNHSIGFVFQNYNLIPHQTVLSNVELAMTLSGVSKSERRKRAIDALKRVGLEDQIYKKPTQMSGGQAQRVAIARAMVNDPDILLADEPTGALDTETSEQVMKLLKEIASDRLVIMVTHNPDLAERYSTRIVKLLDGRVIGDTDFYAGEAEAPARDVKVKKPSMSFFTALSLSFNNLMVKKGRTFLTSFAGSIGIIGIALILALSTGVQNYINDVQRDTLSSYPITILAEETDLSGLLSTMGQNNKNSGKVHELDAVYSNPVMYELLNSLITADKKTNNLREFKTFLDDMDNNGLKDYVSSVQYSYDVNINAYVKPDSGKWTKSSVLSLWENTVGENSAFPGMSGMSGMSGSFSSIAVWQELLPGQEGLIDDDFSDSYELLYGSWPETYSDIVLIVSDDNELTDMVLYCLGLISREEMMGIMASAMKGEEVPAEVRRWDYEEICAIPLKLITDPDYFMDSDGDGVWEDIGDNETIMDMVISNGLDLRISGIIRSKESDRTNTGAIGYTSALTQFIIEKTNGSDIVKAQKAGENENFDVFTGLPFVSDEEELTPAQKAAAAEDYFAAASDKVKAEAYLNIISTPPEGYVSGMVDQYMSQFTDRESVVKFMTDSYADSAGVDPASIENYFKGYTDEELFGMLRDIIEEMAVNTYAEEQKAAALKKASAPSESQLEAYMESINKMVVSSSDPRQFICANYAQKTEMDIETLAKWVMMLPEDRMNEIYRGLLREMALEYYANNGMVPEDAVNASLAASLDGYLASLDEKGLCTVYDEYMPSGVSESTLRDNLRRLGVVDPDSPSSIKIFTATFESKDRIAEIINAYNEERREEDQISYTDYVALLMSSVTTIINAISYVLIAFVSISLVVSSIMIGIITYISVLERTKEIGILRAIGASKKDVARVFNAETLTVGFCAGAIGILATLLMIIPINIIIRSLTGIKTLGATLPVSGAVVLVLISMGLTFIAGLIPSRIAAKKDPVVALRSE